MHVAATAPAADASSAVRSHISAQAVAPPAACWTTLRLPLPIKLQLTKLHEELAVKASELSLTSTALAEHKESLAHTRSQLTSHQQQSRNQLEAAYKLLHTTQENAAAQLQQVQDSLGGQLRQLQQELAATAEAKQQAQAIVARLQQEGEWHQLSKAPTEVP